MISKVLVLAVVLCGITTAGSDLAGRIWLVEDLNKSSEDLTGYRIMFTSKDSAQCKMECNTAFYLYAADGQSITFTFKGQTIRYCPDTRDEECVAAMKKINRMVTVENRIYLLNGDDTLISLMDSQKSPLANSTWSLEELNHSAANIQGYWLKFIGDTSATVHMQCNTCNYQYALGGQLLTFYFGMKGCTLLICQGNSREGDCESVMLKITRWAVAEHRLYLMDGTDTLAVFSEPSSAVGQPALKCQSGQRVTGICIKQKVGAFIVGSDKGSIEAVRLINARGVCVRASDRITGNQTVVHTAGLPAGVYIVRVATDKGARITRSMYLGGK
jgi:hypothetical protein